MRRGCCLVRECPYKHYTPTDVGATPVQPQAYLFGRMGHQEWYNNSDALNSTLLLGHAMFYEVSTNKNMEGKVLLDTGANEVVRSYSPREWSNIDLRQPGTRRTQVKLASGKWYGAGMTANGEYMISPTRQMGIMQEPEGSHKGPWICPMIRVRRELDIDMKWGRNGCRMHGGNLQEPIYAEIINDLPYIDLEQFEDIRIALAVSHKAGRKPAPGYIPGKYEQSDEAYVRSVFKVIRAKQDRRKWTPKARSTPPQHRNQWEDTEATWTQSWDPNTTYRWSFNSYRQSSSW